MSGRPSLGNREKLTLRMPPELHQTLIRCAEDNGRSMNSEIVVRLQASLSNRVTDPAAYTKGPVKR